MADLLLIEDDPDVRDELSEFLMMRGHRVEAVGSLEAFLVLSESDQPVDIAIIDVGLPDGEGYEAVNRLRQRSQRMGIILLTARSGLSDRLRGLGIGSDHYLVKPFSLIELGAIIEALLRRVGVDWQYYDHLKQLKSPEGGALDLNSFESVLIHLLASAPGETISRTTLITGLGYKWGDFDTRRLDTAISRFRARWRDATQMPLPLKTRHGIGYSFDFPIRKI